MARSTARPVTGFAYLDEPSGVLAFAHRGGAEHPELPGLENTLLAFRHAAELGYDYLETDVHLTRDGVLLAFHDALLDRVTDAVGEIGSLTYAEVQSARIGGREAVPTLAEVFDALPEARFNIDLKSEAAVRPLVDFIEVREVHDRVLVGSFSGRRLRRYRALTHGRVPTSAAPWEVLVFRLVPSARLSARVAGSGPAALQIPHRHRGLPITTAGLVRRAHAAGLHVHVWTIDDPDQMRALLELGVDGLMTDRTDLLKDVLVAAGAWPGAQAPD